MEQRADDFFRVVSIHLAPESLDVEGFIHFSYCSAGLESSIEMRDNTGRDRGMDKDQIMPEGSARLRAEREAVLVF
jgi:hypothetical protein